MKLNECSWVAVISESEKDSKVVFYNYQGDENEEITSFSSFFEAVKETINYPKGDDLVSKSYEGETTSAFYATASSVIQDYEEYSGKEMDVPVVKSVVIDCYNGGVNFAQLPTLISQTERTVDCFYNDEVVSL